MRARLFHPGVQWYTSFSCTETLCGLTRIGLVAPSAKLPHRFGASTGTALKPNTPTICLWIGALMVHLWGVSKLKNCRALYVRVQIPELMPQLEARMNPLPFHTQDSTDSEIRVIVVLDKSTHERWRVQRLRDLPHAANQRDYVLWCANRLHTKTSIHAALERRFRLLCTRLYWDNTSAASMSTRLSVALWARVRCKTAWPSDFRVRRDVQWIERGPRVSRDQSGLLFATVFFLWWNRVLKTPQTPPPITDKPPRAHR